MSKIPEAQIVPLFFNRVAGDIEPIQVQDPGEQPWVVHGTHERYRAIDALVFASSAADAVSKVREAAMQIKKQPHRLDIKSYVEDPVFHWAAALLPKTTIIGTESWASNSGYYNQDPNE